MYICCREFGNLTLARTPHNAHTIKIFSNHIKKYIILLWNMINVSMVAVDSSCCVVSPDLITFNNSQMIFIHCLGLHLLFKKGIFNWKSIMILILWINFIYLYSNTYLFKGIGYLKFLKVKHKDYRRRTDWGKFMPPLIPPAHGFSTKIVLVQPAFHPAMA